MDKTCRVCGILLDSTNSYLSCLKKGDWICKKCVTLKRRIWRNIDHNEQKRKFKIKLNILSHYCKDGVVKCQNPNCAVPNGMANAHALTIDHINGGGCRHRRSLGKGHEIGGYQFYRWLKRNGYPEGYQVLCMNCQFIKKYEKNENPNV